MKESFRPNLFVRSIQQAVDRDPAYRYKNVIFTYKHDPARVSRYLDRGWEVVNTTEPLEDDRDFSIKDTKEKIRPQPCISKTKDKQEQVLMRILWTLDEQNRNKDNKDRAMLQLRQSQSRGEKVTRTGDEVIIQGSDLKIG